ncbi:MAG: CHRD domain-containing protein [Phycisphaerae bacterium]|nr:CHRD domain-containing protein [Phycisphaerae bacterium]
MKASVQVLAAMAGVAFASAAASATIFVYTAAMDGITEAPPNASPGIGFTTVTIDDVLNTMRVEATFSGLLGTTTAAHIHAATAVPMSGTAGVATQTPSFLGFPLGVTAGSMDTTFDMTLASSYNASYITANGGTPLSAFAALKSAMDTGRAYFNIHSSVFGGGEIRGFLVPAPGVASLIGLAGVLAARRRR